MRQIFHDELEQVATDLVSIAELVSAAIRQATAALLEADVQLADRVIEQDQAIDLRRNDIDARSIDLLARQAPVASDLRTVVASMRMSGDLERMGDLARHIAQVARMRYPEHAVPEELHETFQRMGAIAERIISHVAAVISSQDLVAARDIEQIDDELDELHREMFTKLAEGSWKHGTTSAVDIALLSRYFERFGDHAVTVARRVVFLVTGEAGSMEPHEDTERR
ncbi:PhoU family transcriptional regulator [Janibacter sp. Soil728]|uniref:phosphate signaling complex protein PhoU n=1 Tax=Janibacter sp. Soil728 TaxID=1736393 RepID=UPI0006F9C584|nr:phosphate signaling complex protein PhoU [Janibacter sp. Soil728]KRE36099.1 PhoU family transcriptional regulator [Janibacter sp. Soil728]